MEAKYGKELIDEKLLKFKKADDEVYGNIMIEHEQRVQDLFSRKGE